MAEPITPAAAAKLLGLSAPPAGAAELEAAWTAAADALRGRLPPENLATQVQYEGEYARLQAARTVLAAQLPGAAREMAFPVYGGQRAAASMVEPGYSPSMLADMGAMNRVRGPGASLPPVPAQGFTDSEVLRPGNLLNDRYEIVSQLGAGGMGVVYTAIDRLKRNEEIAIKVLSSDLSANVAARERFLTEAIIATGLNHPNIVKVHNPEQQGNLNFLTMEKLRGRSLRAVLMECAERKVQLKLSEVLRIGLAVCDALTYAHGLPQPVVHRDIKPENIFICDDGSVRVMDFGLAQKSGNTRLTAVATKMGTMAYMPPEQGSDAHNVDHRADQYAFAVTLYEMLLGQLPQGRFQSVRSARPAVSRQIDAAIMRGLEPSPAKRLPSMAAFRAQLAGKDSFLPNLLASENRDLLATAGLVCLLLAGGTIFYLQKRQAAVPPAGKLPSAPAGAETRPAAKTGAARPADAKPEPRALGGLSVTTTPAGAEVSLGSQFVGTSPARFTNVPVGRYPLRAFLKDYVETTQEIEIVAGNFVTRDITLEPRLKVADPKEFFDETVRLIHEAESYEGSGARSAAIEKWKGAQDRLRLLQQKYRSWQPLAVAQRLRECDAAIEKLQ